ncbi:MAG: type II secretion system protein [Burkholderiales bacterium]|nr:type II secretion system protein [Burkholderiales bacterium]
MKSCRNAYGFTLAELAIVVLIIGLVLAGLVGPISTQFQIAQASANQERMDAARDAVIGFAVANRRLPCPDRTGDGVEDQRGGGDPATFGCAGNIYEGFVPWATLGLSPGDYHGTRLRYRVSAEFTRANGDASAATCTVTAQNPNACTFESSDVGDIPVCQVRNGCPAGAAGAGWLMRPSAGPPATAGAAFVILSHGANRLGGTAVDGTVLPAPPGGSDEALNAPLIAGIGPGARATANPFMSRPTITGADAAACADAGATLCNFDDQLVFVGAGVLVGRLTQAGVRLQ